MYQKAKKEILRTVGCLRYPGASTIDSQLLRWDRSYDWQMYPGNSAMSPQALEGGQATHHTDKNSRKRKRGEGMG